MVYTPSQNILDKYADVLVNFALGKTNGIKKGDVVLLQVPECAKPILPSLQKAVLKAGGHYITRYSPENNSKQFYDLASKEQLTFFPSKYVKGVVDQADHFLSIISTVNKKELEKVDPKKIMLRSKSAKQYGEWRDEKENNGKLSWTMGLYGTKEMAREAGLSQRKYWKQIIRACYLDEKDPVKKWRQIDKEIKRILETLNKMKIESVKIKAKNIDLFVGLGKNRKWLGGSGCNIPSFEVFISPDFRKTEGKISFDQPLYRYGNLVKGISLEFSKGKVVKVNAKQGGNVLKEMIAVEGANQIGEFSLTDIRFSKITKFMAETLYDENFGGKWGNTHIALGKAYKESCTSNPAKVKKADWKKMGFNESVIHTDIVSTENRIVTAVLEDGKEKVIYKNGKFVV